MTARGVKDENPKVGRNGGNVVIVEGRVLVDSRFLIEGFKTKR